MKRVLVLGAAGLVVITYLLAMMAVRHNRAEALGGSAELTERELSLPPITGDSTAIALMLRWQVDGADRDHDRSPAWLTPQRLTEFGLDCHVDATSADAHGHYSAVSAKAVFVVLEYQGDKGKVATVDADDSTQLMVVDADRDPRKLRAQYPDAARFVITRGLVRPILLNRADPDGAKQSKAQLRGRIERIVPDLVFVPKPYAAELLGMRQRDHRTRGRQDRAPRFAAVVCWGTNFEPWLKSIRRLPASEPSAGSP
jgi:hypothetical protein